MKKISIKNLRSLQDTGEIELKPITVLVGKNSTGKSTFLRTFPLFKQTLSRRVNAPLLWYDAESVDFGSFEESITKGHEEESIEFSFIMDIVSTSRWFPYMNIEDIRFDRHIRRHSSTSFENVKVSLSLNSNNYDAIKILLGDIETEIRRNSESENMMLLYDGDELEFSKNLHFFDRDFEVIPVPILAFEAKKSSEGSRMQSLKVWAIKEILNFFSKNSDKRIKDETFIKFFSSIRLNNKVKVYSQIQRQSQLMPKTFKEFISGIKINSEEFEVIYKLLTIFYLEEIIESTNEKIKDYFSSVIYIAPLRASAERYYRKQGLSVDQVDPRGTNIPMFLNDLKIRDIKKYNDWINWLKENFNFWFDIKDEHGHIALSINYENGQTDNLADTGFGYSQILPILLILWQTISNSKSRNESIVLVIEQPELHLHPALQARLIDTFSKIIKISKKKRKKIQIIFETHSETIINRLGYQVTEKQDINVEDINILVLDNADYCKDTQIKSTIFSNEGYLINWPIGFFDVEEY